MQSVDEMNGSPPTQQAMAPSPTMTLRAAMGLFRADLARRSALREEPVTPWTVLCAFTRPGVLAVFLLRMGNWQHARGWRIGYRLTERLLYLIVRSELQLGCQVGPGLVLPDEGTVGIAARARIGANVTLLPLSSIITGPPSADASYLIGDYCVIGHRARVYGETTLAEGTQVKDHSLVLASMPRPGCVVSGIPARRRAQVPIEAARNWNPLRGRPLRRPSTDGAQ